MSSLTPPRPTSVDAPAGAEGEASIDADRARSTLLRFAGWLFVIVAALGAAVIGARLLDVSLGRAFLAEAQPYAGLCLLLLGAGLRLSLRPRTRLRTWGVFSSLVLAFAIAGLSLFETLIEFRLDLSRWFLPGMAWETQAALRVSATTAVCLCLLAIAGGFIYYRQRLWLMVLSAPPLLLSLGELVGYLYGVRRHDSHDTPLIAPTALGIALLSIGAIITRLLPETAELLVGRSPSSSAVRRLLLWLVAIPLVLGALELALHYRAHIELELGVAMLAVANVLLLLTLSLWYTRALLLGQRRERALAKDLAQKEAMLEVDMRMRAERFRAQMALQRSEEKYRTVAILAPVGIFEADVTGGCVFVNRNWMDLTGMSLEDALGKGWQSVVHEEDLEQLLAGYLSAAAAGQPFECEYRFNSRSGKVAWVKSTAVPLRDSSGVISGYIGTVVDVTEQKRVIDNLTRSEANFRSLVDRAPFAVSVFREGNIVYANREYLKLFRYDDLSELMGRPIISTLVHESAQASANERMRALEAGQAPPPARVRCRGKDGSEIIVEGSSASIDFDGVPSMVAVVRDVTDHERVEQVRILAERALRDSLREKEVLLKEIHHRVKNNLQVIVSLINLQASKIEDRTTRAAFDETRSRVHAIALLHERLYRSKNIGRIDMRDYLQGLASDLSSTNVERRAVQLRVSADDLFFEMDTAVPIGLIVNELVTNAYKHAFHGQERPQGVIEVELTKRGAEILVSVTDDGLGYPDGLDFERADTLGLLLITSLSRQLGGRTTFARLERGARAEVRFPAPNQPAQLAQAAGQ